MIGGDQVKQFRSKTWSRETGSRLHTNIETKLIVYLWKHPLSICCPHHKILTKHDNKYIANNEYDYLFLIL